MNGGRLSAAEKGKQKVADADDLPPAADAARNWGRHPRLVPPSGTSEIEELTPSPPPAQAPSRLPATLNAEGAAAAAGLAAVAGLECRLREMQAALHSRLRELEQLRRGRESRRSTHEEVEACHKRRRDGADDEPQPEVAAGAAEVQALQHQFGSVEAKVSGMKDAMLARRLQAGEMQALDEFWKPVVPPGTQSPQRNSNSSKRKALEEFWKPVPVPRRNNSKIIWNQIISLIGLTSCWLVTYISLWIQLPVNNLTQIVGAIFVLWILRSAYSCCQRFRTSRTMSRHVPRLIYVCFWILALFAWQTSVETLMVALALHLRLGPKRQRNVVLVNGDAVI